jgi:hypothetical protein
MAWGLPAGAGQPVTRSWFKGVLSLVAVTFLQSAALLLAQLMLGAITMHLYTSLAAWGQMDPKTLANIMKVSVLWFVLRIPSLLGTAPMRTMMEAGHGMQQAVATAVGVSIAEAQMVVQGAGAVLQGGLSVGAMFVR